MKYTVDSPFFLLDVICGLSLPIARFKPSRFHSMALFNRGSADASEQPIITIKRTGTSIILKLKIPEEKQHEINVIYMKRY